jgi:hypothetical protein
LPGVTKAALVRRAPLGFGGSSSTSFEVEGFAAPKDAPPWGYLNVISPGYFDLMRMPLLKGREFEKTDLEKAPLVAVINNTMAERFWPGKDAVGGRFRIGPDWFTWWGSRRTRRTAISPSERRPGSFWRFLNAIART